MTIHRPLTIAAICCMALLLLAGCSSPRASFYTLSTASNQGEAYNGNDSFSVGPVTLPDLVDRPQLVVRTGANRVEIIESHRWAESLRTEIPRILAEDLSVLLKPARVSAYPQNAGADAAYKILVDIQRFDMTAGEGVVLDALWFIRRSDGTTAESGRTVARESAGGSGYDLLVAAQSRALSAVSRDLAQAVRKLTAAKPEN